MEKFPSSSSPKSLKPESERPPITGETLQAVYTQEHPSAGLIGREKSERFLSLARVRELLGHLLPEEEEEYQKLSGEIVNAQRVAMQEAANTADPIESFPDQEIFTNNDLAMWRDGVHAYEDLSAALHTGALMKKFEDIFNPVNQNALKALFLKGKPAVLLETVVDQNESAAKGLIELLSSFGIQIVGKYVYDAEQVQKVIRENPDVFTEFGTEDAGEIMWALTQKPNNNDLAIGLLLGFPAESVKDHHHKRTETRRHPVNIYGITWTDFNRSLESRKKQARLKAAFGKSGILTVGK